MVPTSYALAEYEQDIGALEAIELALRRHAIENAPAPAKRYDQDKFGGSGDCLDVLEDFYSGVYRSALETNKGLKEAYLFVKGAGNTNLFREPFRWLSRALSKAKRDRDSMQGSADFSVLASVNLETYHHAVQISLDLATAKLQGRLISLNK